MKCLLNRSFRRSLKAHGLDDKYVTQILMDVFAGRAVPLGVKMYKVRTARAGQGKSGGFRNVFFWKKEDFLVFCLMFPKSKQSNLSQEEIKALNLLSGEYDRLTEQELEQMIERKIFKEVTYDRPA